MLNVWGPEAAAGCRGVRRRDFLSAGLLGAAGLSAADLLRARAMAARSEHNPPARSVILHWLDGGPTHIETYDPKPLAPTEYRGPLGTIETSVPGLQLSELLVEHAKIMDKAALLRSVHHGHGDHFAAAHWMLTGYLGSNANALEPQYPAAGAVISKLRGANRPGMPAYVAIPYSMTIGLRPGYNSGAYLGVATDPFECGGDPNASDFKVPNLALDADMTLARLEDRKSLRDHFDRVRRQVDRGGLMDGMDAFQQRAFDMVTGEAARKAFDVQSEDAAVRDRYGRDSYGQSALLARRLVEAGSTFVTIHNGGWDHHWNLEQGMHSRLPSMDRSIGVLIQDLHERGLLESTLVVVMGEFGRTPRMNDGSGQGTPGRDHWGGVMSCLMAGGGVRGGQAVGASNPKGEYPAERPILPADIVATLYHLLGVDAQMSFLNRAGRPIPINNGGTVITELL